MKSVERCFLEIINSIRDSKKEKDQGKSLYKTLNSWSKCRNFKGIDYYLEGKIMLDTDIFLWYFFSNKRSCLYIINENDEYNINLHPYIMLYVEFLFNTYSIDTFINNLLNT